ncbi:MarR family winged helix-turn-helix transcriptional regulator [Maledivibacter halophilus]|uniref:DNA-binding transcriptional regulator, MarR family n=1 Tax=Maledivibacter halophilus TaxID=36842 RepID=A0A1T5L0D0_9FIRM|nr:MarR family transcriptional regulator [Maledivibacter halophilus]SKC69542.1 DNA-binding transcriptional regulator, MarR family [Maledivibacter halophilus]
MELIEQIGSIFSRLYRKRMEIISRELKHLKITTNQSIHLVNINRYPGLNQMELSNILSIDKATVSKTLRNLEKRGFVNKVLDDDDRRYYKLFLSDKGVMIVNKIKIVLEDIWIQNLNEISKEERIAFLNTLNKIYENTMSYKSS